MLRVDLHIDRWFGGKGGWWSAELADGELYVTSGAGPESDGRAHNPKDSQASANTLSTYFSVLRKPSFRTIEATSLRVALQETAVSNNPEQTLKLRSLSLQNPPTGALTLRAQGSYHNSSLKVDGDLTLPASSGPPMLNLDARLGGAKITVNSRSLDAQVPEFHFVLRADEAGVISGVVNRDLSFLTPLVVKGYLSFPGDSRWVLKAEGRTMELPLEAEVHSRLSIAGGKVVGLEADRFSLILGDSRMEGEADLDLSGKSLDARLNIQTFAAQQLERLRSAGTTDSGASSGNVKSNTPAATSVAPETGQFADAQIPNQLPLPAWSLDLQIQTPGTEMRLLKSSVQAGPRAGSEKTAPALQLEFSGQSPAPLMTTFIDSWFWQWLTPIEGSVSARLIDHDWHLAPLTVSLDDLTLSGDLHLDLNAPVPRLEGIIRGGELDLRRLRTSALDVPAGPEEGGYVLPDPQLSWQWLNAAAGNLKLSLEAVHLNKTTFRQVYGEVTMDTGSLELEQLSAELKNGSVSAQGSVTLRDVENTPAPDLDLQLTVENLQPADLGLESAEFIEGGQSSLLLQLGSRGASVPQIVAALEGEVAAEVQSARIQSGWVDLLGSDLLLQLVDAINPLTGEDEELALECAAAYLDVNAGVLRSSEQIVAETPDSIVRGSARINLNDGDLRATFQPTARGGLGIGLGDLSGMVRLDGNLADPNLELDAGGTLRAGAYIGAAVASGGMSILAKGLFDRTRNSRATACGKLLESDAEGRTPGSNTTTG